MVGTGTSVALNPTSKFTEGHAHHTITDTQKFQIVLKCFHSRAQLLQ